ncbi:MAG TPA: 1-(5-phosphoribosyl)-5-[(5-phosphoribosylamino)methylideneamino] imidazole-4-carboxamide isomerase [Alphaproteobacteria bacterium]|nr:1-(5-phosphoribosyl)-5-[(5-phosphoribosylamino)methylideneamino] imidazole-4-carboxamide isomerase [Alphaproteobacteria bacterium]
MILYPSIHIKDGAVARLTRGIGYLQHAEVLHPNPGERAAQFEAQKFPWLHVVDLNGAVEGRPVNNEAVENILKSVTIPIQLSGGIRDMKTIESWLNKGVTRIVLASVAVQNPELVKEACKMFPGKIAVKVDSRGGYVAVTGWAKSSSMKALDLALRVEEAGAAALIYADINHDGALSEINSEAIIDLAFALTTPVIASGGVNSLQDLAGLKAHAKSGIAGLILGRALYSGKINAAEALALAAA